MPLLSKKRSLAGLLAAGGQVAAAQSHGQVEEHKTRMEHGKHLNKANLTEAQRQRSRAVHERYGVQFEALKTQIKADRAAMHSARKSWNTEALLVAKAALERDEAQLRNLRQAMRDAISEPYMGTLRGRELNCTPPE